MGLLVCSLWSSQAALPAAPQITFRIGSSSSSPSSLVGTAPTSPGAAVFAGEHPGARHEGVACVVGGVILAVGVDILGGVHCTQASARFQNNP
jgi:hypothetical protein